MCIAIPKDIWERVRHSEGTYGQKAREAERLWRKEIEGDAYEYRVSQEEKGRQFTHV